MNPLLRKPVSETKDDHEPDAENEDDQEAEAEYEADLQPNPNAQLMDVDQ